MYGILNKCTIIYNAKVLAHFKYSQFKTVLISTQGKYLNSLNLTIFKE